MIERCCVGAGAGGAGAGALDAGDDLGGAVRMVSVSRSAARLSRSDCASVRTFLVLDEAVLRLAAASAKVETARSLATTRRRSSVAAMDFFKSGDGVGKLGLFGMMASIVAVSGDVDLRCLSAACWLGFVIHGFLDQKKM